jgi:predicted alpha/beta-fold hydrolase
MESIYQNPHIQTLYPALFSHPPAPEVEIERFELDDGDFVDCYWHRRPDAQTKAIVTLFHGLAGSFASPYIRRAMYALAAKGFSVVLMHFRGCSGEPNRLPRSYHSGDTEDAKAWLSTLHRRYEDLPLYAVGYSLGGNMLLKLVGEWQEASLLQKAVAVSAPMDLALCADRMERGFSRLYQYHLLRRLKTDLLQKYTLHDMENIIGLTPNEVQKLKTFREFDDAYTAPIHGFKDAAHYYRSCSAKGYLSTIKTETLIIHAADDPFMTEAVVPKPQALSPSTRLHLLPHGGHVGFVKGSFLKPRYWLEEAIVSFLADTTPK